MKYFISLRCDCMSLIRFVNLIRFSYLINSLSMIYIPVNLINFVLGIETL